MRQGGHGGDSMTNVASEVCGFVQRLAGVLVQTPSDRPRQGASSWSDNTSRVCGSARLKPEISSIRVIRYLSVLGCTLSNRAAAPMSQDAWARASKLGK